MIIDTTALRRVLILEFFPKFFHTVHLSGDGRTPITLQFDFLSKFPSTDLKNILYFDITMYPLFKWHMNIGRSPHGLDFGTFGPL